MEKWKIIVIVAIVVFFIIGMITGNYHCSENFCTMITGLVNFVCDVVRTEVKGITTVVGGIAGLFK